MQRVTYNVRIHNLTKPYHTMSLRATGRSEAISLMGLPRRFAPRNDTVIMIIFFVKDRELLLNKTLIDLGLNCKKVRL